MTGAWSAAQAQGAQGAAQRTLSSVLLSAQAQATEGATARSRNATIAAKQAQTLIALLRARVYRPAKFIALVPEPGQQATVPAFANTSNVPARGAAAAVPAHLNVAYLPEPPAAAAVPAPELDAIV